MDYNTDNECEEESLGKKYLIALTGWAVFGLAAYGIHKAVAPAEPATPTKQGVLEEPTLEQRVGQH